MHINNDLPLHELTEGVKRGDKAHVRRMFNLIEDRRPTAMREAALGLDHLFQASVERSHAVGVTGPPGAGKSTLISRLIACYRGHGLKVGVIAIDPSSDATHGALLGDRIRFDYDPGDPGLFVRSMANRGDHGGVSDRTYQGITVLRAAYDVVLVETVGVGQSEMEITGLTDTTLLIIQPGSGDVLQYLKSGIMEKPHVMAVNKSDHPEARRTLNDVRAATAHGIAADDAGWTPPVLLCSAAHGTGIDLLAKELERHAHHLRAEGMLRQRRLKQAADHIWRTLRGLYGIRGAAQFHGTAAIQATLAGAHEPAPFELLRSYSHTIEERLR